MNALVTGANGFVGRHLVASLLAGNHQVLAVVRTSVRTNAKEFGGVNPDFQYVNWDIRLPLDERTFASVQRFQPNAVFHLAAISHPRDCGRSQPSASAIKTNVAGTEQVLDLVCRLKPKPILVFSSSSKVYAESAAESPVAEDAPLAPTSGYGRSKLLAENLIRERFAANGTNTVIARAFQHSGPGQTDAFLLPAWAKQFARMEDPIQVISREVTLDLCDVRDVVLAYQLVAERCTLDSKATLRVVNVGSGKTTSGEEIWSLLAGFAGYQPNWEATKPHSFREAIADTTVIEKLGWKAKIPLSQTVSDLLAHEQKKRGRASTG